MNKIPTIATTDLATATGGIADAAFTKFVDDNAKQTARRFQLVQSGALDRDDFNFFLQNQRRAANVLVDGQRR
jgi:hypothetical protein